MKLTQTPETVTTDIGGLRWVINLDGSETKNVTIQGNPPREVVTVSTSIWEGNSLVVLVPGRSNGDGPYLVKSVMTLDGNTLVIRVTQTSQTTGALMGDHTTRYSK